MSTEIKTDGQSDTKIDLEGCLIQVDASKAWLRRRVLPLSIEQLRWRPAARHWSIAECLDHLNLTLDLYLPKIDSAIGLARRQRRVAAEWSGCEQAELDALKSLEPPVTVGVAAPPPTIPGPAVDPTRTVAPRPDPTIHADGIAVPWGLFDRERRGTGHG